MPEKVVDENRRFTICTLEGNEFDFLNPDPELITIENIAEGLAKCARYAGQTPGVFYSVAEHSVLCSYAVAEENALEALFHDAAEAFTGDFSNPLKRLIHLQTDIIKIIDDRITRAVFKKFGLKPFSTTDVLSDDTHDADAYVFFQERNQIMPEAAWWDNYGGGHPDYPKLQCLEWKEAYSLFMDRFTDLRRGY